METVILNVLIGCGVLAVVAQPSTSRQMQFVPDQSGSTSLPFSVYFPFLWFQACTCGHLNQRVKRMELSVYKVGGSLHACPVLDPSGQSFGCL